MSKIEITNEDNMALMARYPDNYFDLAIVDPEYGIGISKKSGYNNSHFTKYKPKKWDNKIPDKKYFDELFRVSKHQIVWGGNYFTEFLPPTPKWIVWDKKQPQGLDQAMMELAWQSQTKKQAKIYVQSIASNNNRCTNRFGAQQYLRIHPTQKPVKLYEWLLMNYAKEGDKILDTHLGSGSIAIACHNLGFELTACELDTDYYNAAIKRLEQHKSQQRLF